MLDARGVNQKFISPKKPRLGSCAALAELSIPPGEKVYVSTSDIKGCFYSMAAPEWLHPYFFLPKLSKAEGVAVGLIEESWSLPHVVPQFCVLPMGWSWSVYFCQSSHEFMVAQSGAVAPEGQRCRK